MGKNPLQKLSDFGQSVWLDSLSRGLVTSGKLKSLIRNDALTGITSNPSIFEKSIDGSDDYDEDIQSLAKTSKSVAKVYEALAVRDVQMAADDLREVYEHRDGADGYVSLEVNPHLARDTKKTIEEARHLWKAVGRPNVLIKIPGTREGLPAISQCLSEGINVNVTLLFGLPRYREVTEAYIAGIRGLIEQGGEARRIASVASFFLSRIDVLVDGMLEEQIQAGGPKAELAQGLRGKTAIASARQAYRIYKEVFSSPGFDKIRKHGAREQRLLWASTSTKDPTYSDVKYVEALIGPHTVNTLPVKTLDAYRDHGEPEPRLERDFAQTHGVLDKLPELGIDIDAVTDQLEQEGIRKFNEPFDKLAEALKKKVAAAHRVHAGAPTK